MASSVKSVSFTDKEKDLLEYAESKSNFSEYVKELIRNDKNKGFKFSKEQEKAIIELIKKYAPAVKEEDIQKDFDEDQEDFLGQF